MASFNHVASLIILLTTLVCATPAPAPEPSGLVTGLLSVVGNVGNAPPPTLLWTPDPSPECAAINQGELQCCRGALAGDQPLVVFLAEVYGYKLNPNDVNGINCDNQLDQCPEGSLEPFQLIRPSDPESVAVIVLPRLLIVARS
ncbi:hypothetical protein SUNI508_02564 [Seiridium unicorne]|uniref:Hydrophobin n=1 Tax=Seiridium unicorne TaxID=138068 RepID=A0ABR2UFG9_9PEZI